ncbi:MAG: alcohol dehydrogenase, partial [Nocardioidaceae bacterium]|nr:alcohol dehydrogenase [Nocardioidaceae bacterium]
AEAMGASPGAAVAAAGALASEVGVHRRLREVGVVETLVTPIAATARADAVTRNHPRLMDQAEVEDVVAACR